MATRPKQVVVLIRHAEKEWSNAEGRCLHDPSITDRSHDSIRIKYKALVKRYGKPDIIISSPYNRARRTAMAMVACAGTYIPIEVIATFREYLGYLKLDRIESYKDVDGVTGHYVPQSDCTESWADYKLRVREAISGLQKRTERIIFVVTHRSFMSQLVKLEEGQQLGYLASFHL